MKQILALLCALLLFSLTASAAAEDFAEAPEEEAMLRRVRQSVVHLYGVGYQDGRVVSRWTGTGFAVGDAGIDSDIFLTNRHVTDGNGKFSPEQVRLWLLRDNAEFDGMIPNSASAAECIVLAAADAYPDVAVIRTLDPVFGYPALPLRSARSVPNRTRVFALGFPGLQDTHYGMDSGPEDITVTGGCVTDHLCMTNAGNSLALIHSASIRPGNSGGPLVDSDGAVIGQNTYGFPEEVSTELFCSVDIDYGMELLDQLGIPYSRVADPTALAVLLANLLHMPRIAAGETLILLSGAAALLLLFLKMLLLAFRRAKKPAPEAHL